MSVSVRELRSAQIDKMLKPWVSFTAVEVTAEGTLLGERGNRGFNPCVCVTEPCPCDGYDHGNLLIWVAAHQVLSVEATGRNSTNGSPVLEVRCEPGTQLIVERMYMVKAADIAREMTEQGAEDSGCGCS